MLVALLNCSLTHWTSQYMLEMARGWKNLEASEAVSNNAIEGEGDCRTMRVLKFTIHRSSLRHYCAVPTAKKRKKKKKKERNSKESAKIVEQKFPSLLIYSLRRKQPSWLPPPDYRLVLLVLFLPVVVTIRMLSARAPSSALSATTFVCLLLR